MGSMKGGDMSDGWQEVLDRVKQDPEFMETTRRYWENPVDPDRYEVFRLLVEEGLTPWLAARKRLESGESSRTQSTLYYMARQIVKTIRERFGVFAEPYIDELLEQGTVRVDSMMVEDIRAALEARGKTATEDVEIRTIVTFTLN
jgi:hypothetical protein